MKRGTHVLILALSAFLVAADAVTLRSARSESQLKSAEPEALKLPVRTFDARPAVRDILSAQDRIATGDVSAVDDLAARQAKANAVFWSADPGVWSDGVNVHALLVFSLVGGDPRVLRRALSGGVIPKGEIGLANGISALLSLNEAKARELLLPYRSAILPPLLWSAVALSLAPLVAVEDAELALALLDEARLAAPATLIEETALRRIIALHLDLGRPREALTILSRYVWRFPRSPYAASVIESAAVSIARSLPRDAEPAMLSAMTGLPSPSAHFDALLLDLAREFALAGRLEAMHAISDAASARPDVGKAAKDRLRMYRLAANVSRLGAAERRELMQHNRGSLEPRDAALLDLATHAARSVPTIAPPQPVSQSTSLATPDDVRRRAAVALDAARRLLETR